MFISERTIKQAVLQIRGTANHLLKIWFVLKMMGMDEKTGVMVDTGNSTPAIKRLFSCGAPDGSFYIPFSHTPRFAFMKSDASRSIIQTTLQRWATSGSVVTCDPSSFLKIVNEGDKLEVRPGRQYPLGLGHGKNGFALEDNQMYMISPNGKKAKEVRMYKIKYALSYFQYGLHNHSMLFMLFFKCFIINLLFNHYTRIFVIYIKFSHIVL